MKINNKSLIIVAYLTSILSFQLVIFPSRVNLEPRSIVRKIVVVRPFQEPSIDPSESVLPSEFDVPANKC